MTRVDEGADLAVHLSPSARSARAGERFTVTAAVRNRGPRAVRDAHVHFTENAARFVSSRGARCAARHGMVGCAVPPIKPGERGTFSLVFRMPSEGSGEVGTDATVYSKRLGDRRPADNEASTRVSLRRG